MTPTPPSVSLPPLRQHASPNRSERAHGIVPYLICLHRPAGGFAGAEATLVDATRPASRRVSAHVLTDSSREVVQLVPWHLKAWSCASFNSATYNLEVDDDAWTGSDPAGFYAAARLAAFLCKRTGIPPSWSRDPLRTPGLIRHYDLGIAGGGHTDPTTDAGTWRAFVARVKAEHEHGGFRPTYGLGTLHRIDT